MSHRSTLTRLLRFDLFEVHTTVFKNSRLKPETCRVPSGRSRSMTSAETIRGINGSDSLSAQNHGPFGTHRKRAVWISGQLFSTFGLVSYFYFLFSEGLILGTIHGRRRTGSVTSEVQRSEATVGSRVRSSSSAVSRTTKRAGADRSSPKYEPQTEQKWRNAPNDDSYEVIFCSPAVQ
jgi:hypothetical protein